MMHPVHRAASAIVRRLTRRPSPSQRRGARLDLEVLETRQVLSPYVWTGLDSNSPTLWSDPGNWLGGQVPSAGAAVLFQAVNSQTDGSGNSYPTGTTVDIDSADVSAITVQDNYLLEGVQGSSSFPAGQLGLDNNATITTGTGNKLTFASDLGLNGLGGTIESGAGTVEIDEQGSTALNLKQLTVSSGTLSVPQTTELASTLITVEGNATLEVGGGTHSTIGSLNGDGTVVMDGQQATLAIDTPSHELDVFAGSFGGSGGTIQMEGAGSLTIGNIGAGYQLDVRSGTILLTGQASLEDLVPILGGTDTPALEVEPTATFGGPGSVNVQGQALFDGGSTYDVDINGSPSSGAFTSLSDSSDFGSQLPSGVQIQPHTTLSIGVGPGYAPSTQDSFPIISTPQFSSVTITGTFTTVNGPFAVNYVQGQFASGVDSVTVQPQATVPTTTATVGLDPSSTSPSVYGRSVTFDATVAVNGGGTETPTGTVTFYDRDPNAGGVPIGTPQTLSGGHASISIASLSAGTHSIYAVYAPGANPFIGSTSAHPASVTINRATLIVSGLTARDKVYDGTTAATFDTSGATLTGIIGGDSVKLVTSGATASFADKHAGGDKAVTVTGLSLSGVAAGNYTIAPLVLTAGIAQAPLTVTANNQSMTSGGPVPSLSFTVSGLVGGDTASSACSGALATSGSSSSPAGTYAITQGTLTSLDYAIHFNGGILTIAAPPVVVHGVSIGSTTVQGGSTAKKARSKHKTVRAILVTMSGPIDAAAAQDLGNYKLVTVARGKKKSKPIALSGATWSATTMTVTLMTSKPLVLSPPLQLTIDAGGLGLSEGNVVQVL